MMPENSFPKLNDETFPASLLLDFDELDDDIPISPPRILEPTNVIPATGSRSPVTTSQTSNSSSGNYSLSTENENGSGSSSSSNLFVKYRPLSGKRLSVDNNPKSSTNRSRTSPSSSTAQKRSKSVENLLSSDTSLTKLGAAYKSQKYGHVKSKVKQYIDETVNQHTRHALVRHKSLPVSSIENVPEKKDEVSSEHDANTLRAMLKETANEVSNLQRHLEFSEMLRRDDIAKIESLKRKIEAMRVEHSMRDKERQRERESEKELDRKLVLANYFRYSSQTSLNRVFASVSTQTSPDVHAPFSNSFIFSDESIDRVLGTNFTSTSGTLSPPRAKRTLTYVADSQPESNGTANDENLCPDSATHPISSPDYPRLCPTAVVYSRTPEDNSGGTTELLIQDNPESCKECGRKNKKRKSKKTRLASFFCIKKVD